MFEDVFSALGYFFPSLDFLGIPFLFWAVAVAVLAVAVILAFVVFRPKASSSVYSNTASSAPVLSKSPLAPEVKEFPAGISSSRVGPLSKADGVLNQSVSASVSSQTPSSSSFVSSSPPVSSSASVSSPAVPANSIQPQAVSSSEQILKSDLAASKTASSLKQLLITKFQSKIELQLSDKVEIKDVASEGENFLVAIVIAGVSMTLTLDPSGKIIDYKKLKSE